MFDLSLSFFFAVNSRDVFSQVEMQEESQETRTNARDDTTKNIAGNDLYGSEGENHNEQQYLNSNRYNSQS